MAENSSLETCNTELDHASASARQVKPGRYVMLAVSDAAQE